MRFPVAATRIRADLCRVRLHLASAKMGGAAARPVDLDDLGRVAGSYRPRRTHAGGSVALGANQSADTFRHCPKCGADHFAMAEPPPCRAGTGGQAGQD